MVLEQLENFLDLCRTVDDAKANYYLSNKVTHLIKGIQAEIAAMEYKPSASPNKSVMEFKVFDSWLWEDVAI